jgi:hypothetical protein
MPTYRVNVYTGNLDSGARAGTDANVFIRLYGSNGSSDELMLDNAANNFEQGAVDTFSLHLRDLGELMKVRVGHDNSGDKPGWFLDRIAVRNEDSDQEWTFPCSRWLARDEDDGEIDRELDAA